MDEIMLGNLTFCRSGMGRGLGFGAWAAASTMEKQGRNQNAITLEGLAPIQPNWGGLGQVCSGYK